MSTKITKADLIEQLVAQGHARNGLRRLTLAGLQAMVDAPARTEEAAEVPAAVEDVPTPTGDIVVTAERLLEGDEFEPGLPVAEVMVAQKWVYLRNGQGAWFAQFLRGTMIRVHRPAKI